MNDLAVVILNYNTKKIILDCLRSIFDKKWKHSIGVWVVDNASKDGSCEAIKEKFPQVILIRNRKNLGFSGGNNIALKKACKKVDKVFILNSDTQVKEGSLDELINFSKKTDFDLLSCRLLNPDGSFQPNAGDLPHFTSVFTWITGLDDFLGRVFPLPSFHQRQKQYYKDGNEVGWVSGTSMFIKKQVFEEIGFFDENIFMYGEDVDFCWRAKKAGFKIGWTDQAEIIHLGGASFDRPQLNQWTGEFKGLFYLYQKYYGLLPSLLLRVLVVPFVLLRVFAFSVIGKSNYALTYLKVLPRILR